MINLVWDPDKIAQSVGMAFQLHTAKLIKHFHQLFKQGGPRGINLGSWWTQSFNKLKWSETSITSKGSTGGDYMYCIIR